VILLTLDLEPDTPGVDQCGTCALCLEACPTQAFVAPHVMDARRCLAYVTIEQKGDIADDMRVALGAHVYGCDVCQDVCPFNHAPPTSRAAAWQPRRAFDRPSLATLRAMSDDDLRAAMRRSPMKRTGVKGLRRNLAAIRAGGAL
jgi:epoxyqueuosine reductase